MKYPKVLSEDETLDRVLSGRSIARYGDGEFKLCRGGSGIKSQVAHPKLRDRLRAILKDSGSCLVGIPNIDTSTPKAEFWSKYRKVPDLNPARTYASAFISRPDSAPWIDRPDYWAKVQSLWEGRNVTLVRGSGKSLTPERLVGAEYVREVLAPRQHAWAEYDDLLRSVGKPEIAILCLGPTATVMAVDLCERGVHAVDLGHIGIFWKKHLAGEPMFLSKEDKERAD